MPASLVEMLHRSAATDELLPGLLRFAIVLGVAMAVAWIGVPLAGRLLFRRAEGGRGAAGGEGIESLLRSCRGLVLLLGLYEALRSLPLEPRLAGFLQGVVFVLAVLVAGRAVVRALRLGLHAYLLRTAEAAVRDRVTREYVPLASAFFTIGVVLVSVIVVAHHFGQDVTSLVAAFGVGSLAIGLAAQATLGNTIAGFILLVDRPFRPGDRVRLQSGESGEIHEVGIRATRILLGEGDLLIVPNTEMLNSRVVNQSLPTSYTRAELRVRVALGAIGPVGALLLELAGREPGVLRDGAGGAAPEVAVVAIDGRAVELALRVPVESERSGLVLERLRGALAARLTTEQLPG